MTQPEPETCGTCRCVAFLDKEAAYWRNRPDERPDLKALHSEWTALAYQTQHYADTLRCQEHEPRETGEETTG